MVDKKRVVVSFAIMTIFMFSIISVNAGFLSDLFGSGESGDGEGELGQSRDFDVTITMQNTAPEVLYIWANDQVNAVPVEYGTKDILVNITVHDLNGYEDVVSGTGVLSANLTNRANDITTSEDNYRIGVCVDTPGTDQRVGNLANWTCTFTLNYWDMGISDGQWRVEAEIEDGGNDFGYNYSTGNSYGNYILANISYGDLSAFQKPGLNLSFSGISAASKNLSADNQVNITNTGNIVVTGTVNGPNLTIEGRHLNGSANPDEYIGPDSFIVMDIDTALATGCATEDTDLTRLENFTAIDIANSWYTRAPTSNHSTNATLTFCIREIVPTGIPSDSYSATTTSGGSIDHSWIIGYVETL